MKKHYLAALAVTAILGLGASGSALAYGDGNGITGSPHDFTDGMMLSTNPNASGITTEGWNFRGEICRVCHAPHDKQRNAYSAGLLWNRALSTATYTPYVFSEKAAGDAQAEPTGRAKMCLSCHDNTVALGQFDTYADGGVSVKTNGTLTFQEIYADDHFMIGGGTSGVGDLSGTHPISVNYASAYAKVGQMNDPANTAMGASGMINNVLDGGLVQCSSCHDVHNRVSVAGTRLLRVGQTGPGKTGVDGDGTKLYTYPGGTASGLCLTCHNK